MRDFPDDSVVKNLPASSRDTGDTGSVPESGRSPERGNGNPLPYSSLENPMDRGAWWATVHKVTKGPDPAEGLSTHASKYCEEGQECLCPLKTGLSQSRLVSNHT